MNLLNGKPLPTSLNDFSSRNVFAGFASEKNRKGWGKSWFLFSCMHSSSTALLRQENDFWVVFLILKTCKFNISVLAVIAVIAR